MQLQGTLHGRTALVTGAASGIGNAIARAYAAEGAAVVVLDRDAERVQAVAAQLGAAGAHAVDVTDADATKEAVDGVVAAHGRLDVLVNCAGILTEVPLVEMDVATWDRMIDVDLRSVFLMTRWAAPHMVAQRWGRVVNVASQLGLKGGESLTHYSAAKAGVIGFTKAAARELAPHGVLVNAIAPGPVNTPLVDGLSPDWKAAKQAELPLGRFGDPEEIAPTAVLLASDPGGNLYVGQTLGPNSGDVMP
ncbi:SDR family NAD(P)-dependent oxidoreductase [Kineococcus rhizosphaerae]|uniref:3-oxoacyl-[acyl-carrier protein] reductase n=1 Tax=Kineococcus rhizosphaerae TaxID=559628 RepID=A0A2T0R0M0_9ACTN|nr:SDR family NAD(P)-dependent oxidoreductase [Kineococcus rhizosphaerae]PRY12618.1 3-oxoacyl-[acyl-carrier protein] reductase [Kineococcus rhizosphaerae]